ncbi:GAF domain-containing sensor histidine kinase [Actinoplanes palleronii]|uniref:histidine kinase n=1 Tax=Actinoplanes palleronii TaxID=113570 RepID=A0ABQ4BTD3_9ACTN|nr:GAF domain-containing sensor histidine kinase [Actinoplanes palleronii]GIE73940.1 sensor histidine kinase [Actinoplanes palleronii]
MSDVVNDEARLAALRSYRVLDRPRPAVLDDLTRLAATMFDTPIAAVSLVDRDRQWFAGSVGLPVPQTPLDVSFCAHVVPVRKPLIVPDATLDPTFAGYANVIGAPHLRFYAGAPIFDEAGHVLGTVCVVDDVTREIGDRQIDALTTFAGQASMHLAAIRNRLQLADLGDHLARAAQREEDLIATITHELRTPVTTIQGFLELLCDDEDLAPYRRLIEPIERNGRRLVSMIDHILAGTRPPDAPLPAPIGPADLNTAVETAVSACRSLAARRPEPIDVHTGPPVIVRADLSRLSHAIEQLLRNALLFTPEHRPITVRVTADPQPVVEISDAGVGIPDDELPYVFDRFYRGRHARDQAVPGVGLGLTIARATIAAHLGELTVTSDPHGVTARVTLPAFD